MPDGAPIMKVENTKNLGAEVCLVPGTYDDAHDKSVDVNYTKPMTFIHPYDDEQVIAGQGTIGLEILDQLPDVDAVIVPVGGPQDRSHRGTSPLQGLKPYQDREPAVTVQAKVRGAYV